jgi:glycosyltransferase involved in cell wall biosynthesis
MNICIIGNLLGSRQGFVTTQGLILSELFQREGHQVSRASSRVNRVLRLADVLWTLFRNRNNTDVVMLEIYSGLSMVMADASSVLCRILRLPLVGVLHGGDLPKFADRYPGWTVRVLRRCDRLIAPSRFLAERLGTRGFKIRVIPNVVELSEYPFRARRQIAPKLIWMRSFHPLYNPHMAIKVIRELRTEYPSASLVMAGMDKGLEKEVKQIVSKTGLDEAVSFPGFLTREAKVQQFSQADIFINTTRTDNMPVSLLEAFAFGLPVIATRVGGVEKLITHGKDGLMVDDDNVDQMVNAVKLLLNDPELAETISINARQLAETSSWSNVRTQWEDLFTELRSGRSRSEYIEAVEETGRVSETA